MQRVSLGIGESASKWRSEILLSFCGERNQPQHSVWEKFYRLRQNGVFRIWSKRLNSSRMMDSTIVHKMWQSRRRFFAPPSTWKSSKTGSMGKPTKDSLSFTDAGTKRTPNMYRLYDSSGWKLGLIVPLHSRQRTRPLKRYVNTL